MDILFLIGRIVFGGYFLMNAWSHFTQLDGLSGYAASKGVPSPRSAVFVSGLLLLLGGLGIVFGVTPRAALALLIIFLAPVSYYMHPFWKVSDPNARMMEQVQFMKNMALIAALLMMYAIAEPWPYALLQ